MSEPGGSEAVRLDKCAGSERSLDRSGGIRSIRVSTRVVDGESGESVARAQGEALRAIARSLGLMDEKEPE